MDKKLAAIDIGTNSVRILGVEFNSFYSNKDINIILKDLRICRLGRNLEKTQILDQKAVEDTIETIEYYKRKAENAGIKEIYCIATSAVRDAKNSSVLINRISSEIGLKAEIITGEREAKLSFLGAVYDEKDYNKELCVIDIGGGSTELVIGRLKPSQTITNIKSFNIGGVRLMEKFSSLGENYYLEEMKEFIKSEISHYFTGIKGFNDRKLIGVGGTLTTLGGVFLGLKEYDWKKIHGLNLKLKNIVTINNSLINTDLKERVKIPGLMPGREDVIPGGITILISIMEQLKTHEIIIKDTDLLLGIMLENLY